MSTVIRFSESKILIGDNPDINRTQEFVNNNSYDNIEKSILCIVGDINGDNQWNINDLDNDTYKDTKNFLNKLKAIE